MARPKKGRYAQKRDLGLVPHPYERHSKSFQSGVIDTPTGGRPAPRRLSRGRHQFVTPDGKAVA